MNTQYIRPIAIALAGASIAIIAEFSTVKIPSDDKFIRNAVILILSGGFTSVIAVILTQPKITSQAEHLVALILLSVGYINSIFGLYHLMRFQWGVRADDSAMFALIAVGMYLFIVVKSVFFSKDNSQ